MPILLVKQYILRALFLFRRKSFYTKERKGHFRFLQNCIVYYFQTPFTIHCYQYYFFSQLTLIHARSFVQILDHLSCTEKFKIIQQYLIICRPFSQTAEK